VAEACLPLSRCNLIPRHAHSTTLTPHSYLCPLHRFLECADLAQHFLFLVGAVRNHARPLARAVTSITGQTSARITRLSHPYIATRDTRSGIADTSLSHARPPGLSASSCDGRIVNIAHFNARHPRHMGPTTAGSPNSTFEQPNSSFQLVVYGLLSRDNHHSTMWTKDAE
jgi:hypothetical protein